MDAQDLAEWMDSMHLTQLQACELLGISVKTLRGMLKGTRPGGIPRYIALACAAVAAGVRPYRGD